MTLKTPMLRKAGIGLSAGQKAAAAKRALGTLHDIAKRAAIVRKARAWETSTKRLPWEIA